MRESDEEPPEITAEGLFLEPMSGTVIHGPDDITKAHGGFGPGMNSKGKKYQLKPRMMFIRKEVKTDDWK